jgi:hypothetical protein
MKGLIKKSELDILKYKDQFKEADSDTEEGQDRGGDTIEYSVMFRLDKTNETSEEWITLCNKLSNMNVNDTIDLVGINVIKEALSNCGASNFDKNDIKQNCYNNTDTYFEYVFSVTEWVDDD